MSLSSYKESHSLSWSWNQNAQWSYRQRTWDLCSAKSSLEHRGQSRVVPGNMPGRNLCLQIQILQNCLARTDSPSHYNWGKEIQCNLSWFTCLIQSLFTFKMRKIIILASCITLWHSIYKVLLQLRWQVPILQGDHLQILVSLTLSLDLYMYYKLCPVCSSANKFCVISAGKAEMVRKWSKPHHSLEYFW